MINILYVDDEPSLLEVGKAFLEKDGEFDVDIISSAPAALTLLNSKAYDAIISDYQMPELNGIEFLRKVRGSGNTIPFILFTGRGREEVVIQALNEGADFYLQKGGEPKSQFVELSNKIRYAVTRRRAEEALRREEAQLRQIIDLVPHMIFAKDQEGRYLLANRVVAEGYNTTVEELIGKPQALFHRDPAELRHMLEDDREVITGGTTKFIPSESYIDSSGKQRFLQTTKVPFTIPGNNFQAVLGVAIDITEQKRAEEELLRKNEELNASYEQITAAEEELRSNLDDMIRQEQALRENEEWLSAIFNTAEVGIMVVDVESHTILEANPKALSLIGASECEVTGAVCHKFVCPAEQGKCPVTDLGQAVNSSERVLITKDGVRVPIIKTVIPTELRGRKVLLESFFDISDGKKSEGALRESEEKFRSLVENALEAILILDFQGNVLFTNNAASLLIESDGCAGLIGRNVMEFIAPESREDVVRDFTRVSRGRDSFLAHYAVISGKGKKICVESVGKIISYEGKPADLISLRDITEQNRITEALRETTVQLRATLESTADGILAVDSNGKMILASARFAEIWHIPQKLLESGDDHAMLEFVLDQLVDPATFIRKVHALYNSDAIDVDTLAFRDGRVIERYSFPMVMDGARTGRVWSFRDVSERNRAERALRESEEHFRGVVDHAPVGIFHSLPEGKVIDVNPAYARIFGYDSPEEFIEIMNRRGIADTIYACPEKRVAIVNEIIESGGWRTYENQYRRKDGSGISCLLSLRAYRNPASGRLELEGFLLDNSERRLAENALIESKKWLSTIFNAAEVGIILVDAASHKILQANPKALALIGASKKEVTGIVCHTFICPAEEGKCPVTDLNQAVNSSERLLITKDGKRIPIIKTVVSTELGGKKVLVESFFDISEEKKSETALRESEVRYRLLTENMKDVVWQMDADMIFSYVSPSVTPQYGYSPEEVVGKPLVDFCTPASAETVRNILKNLRGPDPAITSRGSGTYELELVRRDGTIISSEVFTNPVFDAAGKVTGWNGITRDITERKRTGKALAEREEKYRGLFAAESDGIVVVDRGMGSIIECNDAFLQMYGYRRDELIGKPLTSASAEPVATDAAIKAGISHIPVRYHQRKDGSIFPVEVTANVASLQGSEVYIAAVRDITGIKQAEKALYQANRKLNLLSGITRHDINNQLLVLQSYLALLDGDIPDPVHRKYFQEVSTAAERISAMIRFAKEYEQIGINAPVWQDVHALIETVAESAHLGTVRIKNDLPRHTEIFADPLISRVFYNLMDNAVKYGSKITTIRFSSRDTEPGLVVACEDDGTGIPAGEKEKIFERGFGKNTGLGLALSREILAITGITIRETGQPGSGARFEIVVPRGSSRVHGTGKESGN